MPYIIALGLLVLNKKLAESPNRTKAALHMGRITTDAIKRSIKNE